MRRSCNITKWCEIVELKLYKEHKFEKTQMIAAWPGMALLAKMSVDYLVRQLDAKPFAEIYSRGNSVIVKDGIAEISSAKNLFYRHRELIMFSGEEQPAVADEVYRAAELVMDFAERSKVRKLYTIAAFPTGFSTSPKVFAVVNNPRLLGELEKLKIPVLRDGLVTGLNGVLIGVAKERGIDGICLLGQVHSMSLPQPRTMKVVLDALAKMLGIDVDTSRLEKEAELMEESIRKEAERFQQERIKRETERYIS